MKIGFVGLGKMGLPMVLRLLAGGHEIVVSDHHPESVAIVTAKGAVDASASREALVAQLGEAENEPKIVWLMISARVVDAEIDELLKLLPAGSILIDGGNSDFRDTRTRFERCAARGVHLVDVGTSGGILGAQQGYSIMAGGEQPIFATIEPLIQTLAYPNGYQYFGPSGAGHYVKMIHNAVEYGMMEAYAEGYQLLKEGKDYPGLDLGAIAAVWQQGSIVASSLNGLAKDIFEKNPELTGIDGYVAESGEARWTLEVARAEGIEASVIQAAMDRRLASQQGQVSFGTKVLAAMRNAFGGHNLNK